MGLPSKLKKLNLYNGARSWIGELAEFTQPKIVMDMEEWRGAGMLGPVKVDRGLKLMEAEMKIGGLMLQMMRQIGTPDVGGVLLMLVGAYQADNSSAPIAVEIVMRGRFEEIDMGTAKEGDDTEHVGKFPLAYYKLIVNGRTEIEIDMLSGLFVVDGVDRYAQLMSIITG